MTKEQFEMVKTLLSQGYVSTTRGDFSLSLREHHYSFETDYQIHVYSNDNSGRLSMYDMERVFDVVRVVGVWFMIKSTGKVPFIKIS